MNFEVHSISQRGDAKNKVSAIAPQAGAVQNDRVEENPMHIFQLYIPQSVIAWVVIGLLAGWIAGKVSRGRGFGCIANILLGLVGAVLGGWIFTKLGIQQYGFIYSLAAATVGAVILVAIARLFSGGGGNE